MKVGLVLQHWEEGMAGATPRISDILEHARVAEDIGFDSIWLVDHFLIHPWVDLRNLGVEHREDRKDAKIGVWECWTVASAVAASTQRVEIGTGVANTGYRNPALLAKMAETVDEVSGGRLILGLGAGNYIAEHGAFGYPLERRVSRFEEALQIICPLARGESVSFEGEFYQTKEAVIRPKGPRQHGPPILIGVLYGRPRMSRLVTQYADHWNCWVGGTLEGYKEPYEAMMVACEKHGRNPTTLKKNVTVVARLPDADYYEPLFGRRGLTDDSNVGASITGSPSEIVHELRRYADFGVDHVCVYLIPTTSSTIEALGQALEQL